MVHKAVIASLAAALLSCQPEGATEIPSAPLIYGGTPVADGAWPAVVGVAFSEREGAPWRLDCTGTLIAPTVVLTAGHCLKSGAFDVAKLDRQSLTQRLRIYTGLGAEGGEVATPHQVKGAVYHPLLRLHPLGYGDVGLIFLAAPLAGITPVPLVASLADQRAINQAAQVTLVGYGRREDLGRGVKYEVETTLRDATAQEAIAGGEGKDACGGDSGGPAFAPAKDLSNGGDGWVQVGIVSRGVRLDCGSGGYVTLVSDNICWIEQQATTAGDRTLARAFRRDCRQQVPAYTDAKLAAVDFAAFCSGRRGNTTQRQAAQNIHLALGSASCGETATRLRKAKSLTLDGLMLRDLSPLAGLPALVSLSVRGNRLDSIAPLRTLPALRELKIHGNDVADLNALAAQEAQGLVILGKRRQLHNVAATAFLAACQDPELDAAARLTVRAVLAKTLAEDCATANERLLSLRTLSLRDRNLTDLTPLAGMEQLESLDLANNPLGTGGATPLTPLVGLEALRALDLSGTGITDLDALAPLLARGLTVTGVP